MSSIRTLTTLRREPRSLVRAAVIILTMAALAAFPLPSSSADTPPALSIEDSPTLVEPAPGQPYDLVFPATLDQPSTVAVEFQVRLYRWRNTQFVMDSFLLSHTFAPGATSLEISIPRTGDTYDEHPYYLYELRVEGLSPDLTLADGTATAIVTDTTRNGIWACFALPTPANNSNDVQQACDGGEHRILHGASPDGTTRQFTAAVQRVEADPLYPLLAPPAVGDHASAYTEVGWLHYEWQGVTIEAKGLASEARLRCDAVGPLPTLTGWARVDHLRVSWTKTVAGQPIQKVTELGPITGPLTLRFGDVTVAVNSVVQHSGTYADSPALGSDLRGEPHGHINAAALLLEASGQTVGLARSTIYFTGGNACVS